MSGKVEKLSEDDSQVSKTHDYVFIGTSPICILEAAYQASKGNSVLMIDNNSHIGGSWCPVDIFGMHDIENAIHYFLQDPVAFDFMKDTLGWKVVVSKKKYRVFNRPVLGIKKISYDNIFGRIISHFLYESTGNKTLLKFLSSIRFILKNANRKSVYLKEGSSEIIRSVNEVVKKFNLKMLMSTQVKTLKIDQTNGIVYITVSDGKGLPESILKSRKIFITHGTKLRKIDGDYGEMVLNNKIHPRPAVHLLVNDSSNSNIHELIFMKNPLIKYVHDVTQYTREALYLKGKKKVLVFALQHDIVEYPEVYNDILSLCKENGMIGPTGSLEDSKWWNIFLPTLDDNDLIEITNKYKPVIEWLSTENFAKGIGLNANRWSNSLKFNVR